MQYCVMHKKQVVYPYTKDFYACLDALKGSGPGRQMVREDGTVIAFNPQQGVPPRVQYAQFRKEASDGESQEASHGEHGGDSG